MPEPFFQANLDYVIFFKSLSLLFMAAIAFSLRMKKSLGLRWEWMIWCSVFACAGTWGELLASSFGDSPVFTLVRLSLKITAYLCLVEFIRLTAFFLKGRGWSRWIILPCVGVALAGLPAGLRGLELSSRWTLEIAGSLAAVWILFAIRNRIQNPTNRAQLRMAAVAMTLYAVIQVMDGPQGRFFPNTVLNRNLFLHWCGFPIQMLQGFLLLTVDIAFWRMLWSQTDLSEDDPLEPLPSGYRRWTVPLLLLVFLAGWLAVDYFGRNQERLLQRHLTAKTQAAALAVTPARLQRLTASLDDFNHADYLQLAKDLGGLVQSSEGTRHVWLKTLRNGRLVWLLDLGPGHRPPGLADSAPAAGMETGSRASGFRGPWTDRWGTWVSAWLPIADPVTGRVLAVLGLDEDFTEWESKIALSRLAPIAAAALLSLLLVGFFISMRWFLEYGRRVARSENRYRALFMNLNDGYAYFRARPDNECVFLDVNPAFTILTGLERRLLIGKTFHEALAGLEFESPWIAASRRVALNGERLQTDFFLAGCNRWLRISGSPRQKGYGVLTLQDVTQVLQAEDDLRKWRETAEASQQQLASTNLELEHAFLRANQLAAESDAAQAAKVTFFTNISHKIRTPMNGLMGMIDLVLDTSLSPEQREYLSLAKVSADSFMMLLNDLLDLSRTESGQLELASAEFRLRKTLHGCLKTLGMRAQQKGLELICEVAPDAPEGLIGDAMRLRQVINNLVGNAMKFTDQGEILLSVSVENKSPHQATLRFSVQDSGPGIAPAQRDTVAQLLQPGQESGGQSLGLVISRRLVEQMQGRLWFENRPAKGALFHFTAVFGLQPNGAFRKAPVFQGRPILIVDKNPVLRQVLERYCVHWGMPVTLAPDARSAFLAADVARQTQTNFSYLLADSGLPDLDVFSFVERMRALPAFADAAILLMTSYQKPWDEGRCRAAGVAACLIKPVTQSELLDALALAAGSPLPAKLPVYPAGEISLPPHKILLAENNQVHRMLGRSLLEKWGQTVFTAENGRQVMALTAQNTYDLLLLDLQMPEMDGFETTTAIRELEKGTGRHLPIVALTAQSSRYDRSRCLASGMDGYALKPIDPMELYKTLLNFFPEAAPDSQL